MHSICWYSVEYATYRTVYPDESESFVFDRYNKNAFQLRICVFILIIILFHFICRFAELSILRQQMKHLKLVFLSLADSGSKPTEFFDGYARFKIFDHLLTQYVLFICRRGGSIFMQLMHPHQKYYSILLHAKLAL